MNKSKAQITTSTNNTQTNVNAPVMAFDRVSHDFGTIKEGEAVERGTHESLMEANGEYARLITAQ